MQKLKHNLLLAVVFILTISSYQNCGDYLSPEHDIASVSSTEVLAFTNTVHQQLRLKCIGCHTTTPPAFVKPDNAVAEEMTFCQTTSSNGQILCNKANPAASRFVTKINGGHSGMGAADASAIQSAIQSWAQQAP